MLVRRYGVDPINILTADDLETLIRREARKMPPRPYGIIEGIFRTYLFQVRRSLTNCCVYFFL